MNVDQDLYLACTASGSICMATYQALHTTVDLAGMYDLIEMAQVNSTWQRAAALNSTPQD